MKGETKEQRKQSRKEVEKLRKQQEKADKKAAKEKAMSNVFDLDKVGVFPQDYVNQIIRFKRVIISDIQNYTENGETLYFVEVNTTTGKRFLASPLAGQLNFVTDSTMAKNIYDFGQEFKTQFGSNLGANLTVEVKSLNNNNGLTLFFAKINCIEFLGLFNAKLRTYGTCD
jgi:hypothetical protein